MQDDDATPGLQSAYGLTGPEANRRLYAAWAATYDSDFAQGMAYRLPALVAGAYAALGGRGPVIDIGAGTGLVGVALAERGVAPVDGVDLSPEMLAAAREKGVYRHLAAGDVLAGLPLAPEGYAGAVSAGTFTLGHLGPEGLDELLRLLAPGGLAAISVNERHFHQAGFARAFTDRADRLGDLTMTPEPIYGPGATGEHARDLALIVTFRRR